MRGLSQSDKNLQKAHFDIGRIYTAKIKDNRDPERNGKLRVWIKEAMYDEDDHEKWLTVRYAPPFFGTTPDNPADEKSFESTKKSYGMWFIPPDIGNYVLVCFINNDNGFWFASVPEGFMNNMVPGIPSEKTYGSESNLPAAEYNRVLSDEGDKRPSHDPLVNGLLNQGLASDHVRGQSTSSARREAPSRVQGILTPRGHQIVIDDGWNSGELPEELKSWGTKVERSEFGSPKDLRQPNLNPANQPSKTTGKESASNPTGRNDEVIRFRTRSGAQIMISETFGHIYFITRDGESWIELNNDGNIDFYGTGSFNVRSEVDVNLRADRDLNFEAGRNLNMKAAGGDIKIHSSNDTDWVIDGNQTITISGRSHQSCGGEHVQQSGSGMHLNSGGSLNLSGSGSMNLLAGGSIIQSGAVIHLNGPAATPANSAEAATAPIVYTNVNIKQRLEKPLFGSSKSNTQVQDNVISSISPRVPTHEPWVGRGYENPFTLTTKGSGGKRIK